ncbi:MAG: SURF1 family protein [Ilumatobacteraceae bacterium]
MPAFLIRPKWIVFHVVVVAAIMGMLAASRWQWDKYNAREDFVTMVEARQDRVKTPPIEIVDLLATLPANGSAASIEYRIGTASGSYLPTSLQQINRTQDGVNGVNVLTPFQIDGGPIVVVNRGFVPDGTVAPAPPSGSIRIGGTMRTTQARRTGELTDNAAGNANEVRRIDLELIADRLGVDVVPVYLDFIASEPASPSPPVPVPPPDVRGGPPHLSYTIQWLIFSACAALGWVFAVRRSVATRRRRARVPIDPKPIARAEPPEPGEQVEQGEQVRRGAEHPVRPSA